MVAIFVLRGFSLFNGAQRMRDAEEKKRGGKGLCFRLIKWPTTFSVFPPLVHPDESSSSGTGGGVATLPESTGGQIYLSLAICHTCEKRGTTGEGKSLQ